MNAGREKCACSVRAPHKVHEMRLKFWQPWFGVTCITEAHHSRVLHPSQIITNEVSQAPLPRASQIPAVRSYS